MIYRKNETIVGLFVIIALAIFTYLIFQIGVIRFDRNDYNNYTICFVDLAGLTKKDDLRIAGVKVGFIQDIALVPGRPCPVQARVKIVTNCELHQDAYAVVRQDGLLGRKFLEIIPGSFDKPRLEPHSFIPCKQENSASIDTVICKANAIASDVQQVACTIKQALVDSPEIKCVKETVAQVKEITGQLAAISKSLNQLIATNQNTVNTVVKDVAEIVTELKKDLPAIVKDIKATTDAIANKITPNVEKDIQNVTENIKEKIDQASEKINNTIDQINNVATKINSGEGSLGKLINDKDTYDNVKVSVQCLQNTASRWSNVKFGFDAPFEAYHCISKPGSYDNDFKGYLNGYIWPTSDVFLMGGIEGRKLGTVKHEDVYQGAVDAKHVAPTAQEVKREYDHWLWNLQVGKTFNDLCLRGGIFESTFGLGIDYTFPFAKNSYLQTSLEAYDFTGKLRINDDRPHLRWLNRLYLNPNVYLAFGVDDFISRNSKSIFVGAGIAFGSILHVDQKNV
jgi:phospholipid/cholesterol/gamma-HCH transport system substrate-binding protein